MTPPPGPFPRPNVLALIVASAIGLAACGGGSTQPSPAPPSTTTAPAPTSGAITRPTSGPTTAGSPTTVPATSSAPPTTAVTTAPTSAAPDPRTVPPASLARPGTTPVHVLYGDLDGDGVEDIVLDSVERGGGPVPQSYLDAFLYDGKGAWQRAWSATDPAPPGDPSAPAAVLQQAAPGSVSQDVDFLALVDTAGDGSSELAVGVLNLGAGPGPLDVWVIGFGPDGPSTEFWEETVQDGTLLAGANELRLQTPWFRPSDPACCPSRIEHQTIGFDPASKRVRVLHRTFTPVS
ncbi:MAG TPA: hypothetical protein VNN79_21570 [Actinomycetota bacterium]|nr:hypothetical protein [Actinomycetota bacterium]